MFVQIKMGKFVVRLFPMIITIIVGCAGPLVGNYGGQGRSREEFTRYVENVFMLQNNVTSRIMLLMDTVDDNSQKNLLTAEQQMREQCSPINEYATRDMDGLSVGLWLKRRVEKSAEACDKAAHQAEALLNNF
jgi:hypothetical protein